MIPNFLTKLFGANWRTTATAYGGAAFTAIYPIISNGNFDITRDWKNLLAALGIVIFGHNAKDKQVTGTDKAQ